MNNITKLQLSILPQILGLSMLEKNSNIIQIHSHPTPNPAHLQEIIQIKQNPKTKEITIYTKSQSEERKAFVAAIEKDKKWTTILDIVEEEFGYARITQAKEERANVLGTSELQTRFFEMPDFLDARQRQILGWYLPYAAQIRESEELIANAIFSITGQRVKLQRHAPKIIEIEGVKTDNWTIGSNQKMGGKRESDKSLIIIKIGFISMEDLPLFIPKGYWRRFLEEAFLPHFLPENCDWEIQILLQNIDNQFVVPSGDFALRIGINSFVR